MLETKDLAMQEITGTIPGNQMQPKAAHQTWRMGTLNERQWEHMMY